MNSESILNYKPRKDSCDQRSQNITGKRIMVASPARNHDWVNQSVITYANIVASIPEGNFPILNIEPDLVHFARTKIFAHAHALDVDYLISVDSDSVLINSPGPIVPYLIRQSEKYDAQMICGLYLILQRNFFTRQRT